MGSEKRILMVDDKVTLCFAMREYFKLHNYQVDCAHSLDEATTRLNSSRYAVIIADLDLDGTHSLDGFKVIKMAREQFQGTRVIVLTAYGSTKVESAALDLGVSAFLHKPMPLSEVARMVFDLIGDKPHADDYSKNGPIRN
jgi:DNA-binding response OmpR family regulator